jgi:DNA-directed RNA polymerase specialized sigma24 family protein
LPGVHQGAATNAARLGEDALAYVDGLQNFAGYLTDGADAEDLVQETYARPLQAADQFTTRTNPKA